MRFKRYLIEEIEVNAQTKDTMVSRMDLPFTYTIDTEKMTVTASWGWQGKSKYTYKAKSVKQAWWNWYNPWKKGGFMKKYDDDLKKEGVHATYK